MHPRLLTSMVLLVGSLDDAREATDEALARALLHWDRVANMDSPDGWVYRVAVNVARRRWRRSRIERTLLARQHGSAVELPERAWEAWDAVARLPLRQRTAVVLRYVADLTEADVATVMGVSRSTVSATLIGAHKSLARSLRADLPGEVLHD